MGDVRERPILFSGEMVRAILAGRKTQTRRLVRGQKRVVDGATIFDSPPWAANDAAVYEDGAKMLRCPYGAPGDRLWVQESHTLELTGGSWVRVETHVDWERHVVEVDFETLEKLSAQKTVRNRSGRPGRFMPRWASRITLEVVSVRAERLHDIAEEDARAEGVRPFFETLGPTISREQTITTGERAADAEHRAGFALLWDELNEGRATWKSNPWVWRVEFRRMR